MKRALFFLVVVLGILAIADVLLHRAAESAAANIIDRQIEARVDPEVSLGGFPFLPSLLTGRFDEVVVSIPRISRGPLVIQDIELTFEDVRLEALEVLGGRGNLRAKSLRGRGVISETRLTQIVADAIPGASVEIEEGRVALVRDGVEVDATAIVAAGNIVIGAGEAVGAVEIPLPGLLPDIQFSSLEAQQDEIELGIRALNVRVRA